MEKDFDRWNEQKKLLNTKNEKFFFKEGEIWWCSIGMNVGAESYGKGQTFNRPVLVLKKLSEKSFIGIPLSSKIKQGSWFIDITLPEGKRTALLYQIRMLSTNRFQWHIDTLESEEFMQVKQKLKQLLELL
jgi:mRNA interferase MazF